MRNYLRKCIRYTYKLHIPTSGVLLDMQEYIPSNASVHFTDHTIRFKFLNQEKTYHSNAIDWANAEYGRLWNYNLNYFDFLHDENISSLQGCLLIRESIRRLAETPVALEPYPITLRCMNWIKFFAKHKIQDAEFDASLYAQYKILQDNLEYHLLHNHLLANAISLCIGGIYFHDKAMFAHGKNILMEELEKQILPDGMHFERSPMYHALMLEHLLDLLNVIQNNAHVEEKHFQHYLHTKAEKMYAWLSTCTFRNGDIPFVNDSAESIAKTTLQLKKYAERLGIALQEIHCSASGYRFWKNDALEFFFDVGELSVSYQAGHAHADTFSFILYINNKPFIIDPGVSTYEKCGRRNFERATRAHNTVAYNDENSSDVWDVFRTGKRAHVRILEEDANRIVALHNGYKRYDVIHERQCEMQADKIIIKDYMQGNGKHKSYSYLYFHEDIHVEIRSHRIVSNIAEITFADADAIELLHCEVAHGFNRLVPSKVCRCTFTKQMTTSIQTLH
jgi:hypothetical protein